MSNSDKWKSIKIIGKIFNLMLLAAVSAGFGYCFDQLNIWTTEKGEALQKASRFLSSENEEVRYLTTIFLTGFEDEKVMVRKFFEYIKNKETKEEKDSSQNQAAAIPNSSDRVNDMMADNKPSSNTLDPPRIITQGAGPSTPDNGEPIGAACIPAKESFGWIYLGRFDSKVDCWIDNNFGILDYRTPEELVNTNITAAEDKISIRTKPPSLFGIKGKLLGILMQGSEVTIREMYNWAGAGYYWAKVAYQVKTEK